MKSRSMGRQRLNEYMCKVVAQELRARGITRTRSGVDLRNATYQELKWTYALELARMEE